MARNRIIYASQSVWCNGEVLYRVQSFGSTTTFTSEDIFELGHLDIIDVVDDVPSVAVTLNTNDFGDVRTLATLAQVLPEKRAMDTTASGSNANLEVVDSAMSPVGTYLHGACLADFAVTCGNLPGVSLWAPVQEECSIGSLANNIDQTVFLDKVYINSLEFAYSSGANATENYGAETDNKMWLLNDGRFVNQDSFDLTSTEIAAGQVSLTLDGTSDVAVLSNGLGFLRKDENGAPGITVYDISANTAKTIAVITGTAAVADSFVYNDTGSGHVVYFPTNNTFADGDRLEIIYAANAYGTGAHNTYFEILNDTDRPDFIGALRQGQVEVHIISETDTAYDIAWRLTGCTISCDLTREPLSELGHLAPYDRPLTMPIPVTVSVDSTAGDLENWAKVANKLAEFDAGTLEDLDLADLMTSEDLKLIVKVYAQTDEEAGGTGSARRVASGSKLIGQNYWNDGVMGTYAAGDIEHPLKTVVVEHLKITDEGMTLDMGSNATQTFSFRSTNDLYVVKGDLSISNITNGNKVRRVG